MWMLVSNIVNKPKVDGKSVVLLNLNKSLSLRNTSTVGVIKISTLPLFPQHLKLSKVTIEVFEKTI